MTQAVCPRASLSIGNLVTVGRGVTDMVQNGANFSSLSQVVFGGLGFAGNLGGVSRARGSTAPDGGLLGLATDLRSAFTMTARRLATQANEIWTGKLLLEFLANVSNARRVGTFLRGSERIVKRHFARLSAAHPGISGNGLGTLVHRDAVPDILDYAKRLGLDAIDGKRNVLRLDGFPAFRDEGLASFRIPDILLPRQEIAIELTTEVARDLTKLSSRKQGQVADYYLAGYRTVIITPH